MKQEDNVILIGTLLAQLYDILQGFQLSRIERESPAWTLFLPLSRQACKISHINEKNPAKHVKSPASVGKKALGNNCLANFQCNPKNQIY